MKNLFRKEVSVGNRAILRVASLKKIQKGKRSHTQKIKKGLSLSNPPLAFLPVSLNLIQRKNLLIITIIFDEQISYQFRGMDQPQEQGQIEFVNLGDSEG